MKLVRRRFLHLAASAAALPAVSGIARAQAYPTRPVRIIVGFAAGGPTDLTARLLGQWLSERLGRQFVIENRPGAAGNIATEAVVKAPPDGYTLLLVVTSNAANEALFDKLNFNFLRDITPIAGLTRLPYVVLSNPSFPAKTIPEFIAYAKANPGKLNIGAVGGTTQVAIELFKMMADVNIRYVPYRGDAPGLTDLLGGQLEMYLGGLQASIEQIKAGKLRALAVTTATRSEALPDIPAVGEFVTGYEASAFQGVGVPKNTPIEIIEILNNEINAGLADPAMKAQLAVSGNVPMPMTPAEFGKFIAEGTEMWARVVKASGKF
jgi:tripartite-type tricarboxylate transporter receptor subunit TctC